MQGKTLLYICFTLALAVIFASCNLQANTNPTKQPSPTLTEIPKFEWRSSNAVPVVIERPFFTETISLNEPDLCLEDLELVDTLHNADESVTLLFRTPSGTFINHPDEMIPKNRFVALIDGFDQFYPCEVDPEAGDLMACSGPYISPGTEISVRFGKISSDEFEGLAGNSTRIDLPELWKTKKTNLESYFDFRLADETAILLGAPAPATLKDAYDLITAAVSLNSITGGGWGEPSWLLMSSFPQFQKTGLPCDSYWECAKACAKEINYDLRSDDLIGAFDFYKNFASKLGGLLPETCQAFNSHAEALTPRPGTPQYLQYQWEGISADRLTLYDPMDQLFDLYDSNRNWEPRRPPTAVDRIPEDIKQCAATYGWPYGEITDLEAFLNWYFNILFDYRREVVYTSNQAGGSVIISGGELIDDCDSDETRAWIELATNEITNRPQFTNSSTDSLLQKCAVNIGYDILMWPYIDLDELDVPQFLVWLMHLWSQSPESIPNACTAFFASDEFLNHLSNVHYELDAGRPICTLEQELKIEQARTQFQNENSSCNVDEDDSCAEYSNVCQENSFINSLVQAGTIEGPKSCWIESSDCFGNYQERPYVPPGVWECGLDTCLAGVYPLNRGEGVFGFSLYLNTQFQNGSNQLPPSCYTAEVSQWVWQNYDCASENYSDDTYDYSSCGLPYQDMSSGNCFAIPTGSGYIIYCPSDSDQQACPSCSTVYQCAEGEESILCGEGPGEEDPGYWGQLNLCAEQIEWDGGVQTYQDASDLVQYLITAAPFLKVEDVPAACKVSVEKTLIPGLPYGEFLTKITLGGKVEGSSVCSEAKQFTIPEETTVDRCDEFSPSGYQLRLHEIPYNSNLVTLYLSMPGGVPGLEREVPEDTRPWEYAGQLGNIEAMKCGFYDYPNRLFCTFEVPQTYMDTVRPLQISVNGCEVPFYSHPSVSIIPEEPPKESNPGNVCVKPPPPTPDSCWIWSQEKCKWECFN